MKGSTSVSPMTAGIIIAIVVVVVIVVAYRFAQGPGKVVLTPEQVKQMNQMRSGGTSAAGGRAQVSGPPPAANTGK